jgi:CRP/FNR family cyclic AMP-dependent transcriptional regulator
MKMTGGDPDSRRRRSMQTMRRYRIGITRKARARRGRIEQLRSVALFSGCGDRQLWRIAALTTEHRVQAGRVLTVAGELGDEVFVVIEGTATVSRDEVVLGTVGGGSFFGEISLLDGSGRTATVTADTDMVLLALSRSEFHSSYFLIPPVMGKMLTEVGRRLRGADEALSRESYDSRRHEAAPTGV